MINLEFDDLELRKEKKERNINFHKITEIANINMSDKTKMRIKDCGSFLEFLSDKDYKKFKLAGANFCENRFCPNCNYNLSRKLGIEMSIMCKYIIEKFDYNFIFLTLTAPNVDKFNLSEELYSYYESFKKLFKCKDVKKISKGYIRKLEITYNSKRDDFHPHYHVLIAVDKSYFTSRNYLSRTKWLELWQRSKNDYSITQVDVRKVKSDELINSLLELSKYLSKDSNYLYSRDIFEVFYKNLKGKQYITFSGCFKDTRKLYKLGKLDYLKEIDTTEYIYRIFYIWKNSDYLLKDVLELSDEEKEKYNGYFFN